MVNVGNYSSPIWRRFGVFQLPSGLKVKMKDRPLASRTSCNAPPHGSLGITGVGFTGEAVWEKRNTNTVGEVLGGGNSGVGSTYMIFVGPFFLTCQVRVVRYLC